MSTPYEEFNIEMPEGFPEKMISPRAAKAVVKSECWTDANPMLNLSSFVTTFMETEAKEIFDEGSFRNFADPDMYPHTKDTESKCVKWLHDLWNGPKDAVPYGAATIGSRPHLRRGCGRRRTRRRPGRLGAHHPPAPGGRLPKRLPRDA